MFNPFANNIVRDNKWVNKRKNSERYIANCYTGNMEPGLNQKIIQLEKELHGEEVRKDSSRLREMIHNDFKEIGSSGKIYFKSDLIERLPESKSIKINSNEYEVYQLSKNVIQLVYKTEIDGKHQYRSSVWKQEENNWQMIFHQGTPIELD